MCSPLKSRVIGANQYNNILKNLAHMLGYTNPDTNTGQGARKAGLSHLCNANVGISTVTTVSRHSNINTTAFYHATNQEDWLRASLALQGLDYQVAKKQKVEVPPTESKEHSSFVQVQQDTSSTAPIQKAEESSNNGSITKDIGD